MPIRAKPLRPSTASRVLVRIDEYTPWGMNGCLYCPYLDRSEAFTGEIMFIEQMEKLFNYMDFPQAAYTYRRFDTKKAKKKPDGTQPVESTEEVAPMASEPINPRGKDVFVVHVKFRQNATWQGTVKWAGGNQERHFRSALELLKMMDEVLVSSEDDLLEMNVK